MTETFAKKMTQLHIAINYLDTHTFELHMLRNSDLFRKKEE